MALPAKRGPRPWWMTPFGREPMGDVFFDRLWPEWQRDMGEEWSPAMNFYEKDNKYVLTAELPGMNKGDINVTVDQGVVTVTGKRESTKEEETADYYLKESSYGSFSRSFRLPGEVEEDKVDATFKDGVLTLTMPHKKEAETRKISIK
ncbi:MAG: Hsp20/alpha crystallin family protein [Deltaproteobacteria bacterium]|nr:Hsp20/alpha crystallin family protein [Deltaproteobacteria bacterium]